MASVLTLTNLYYPDQAEPALLLAELSLAAGTGLALAGLEPSAKNVLWQRLWGDGESAPGTLHLFGEVGSPQAAAATGRLAYISEALTCYPQMTVWENLSWRADLFAVPAERGRALIEQLNLNGHLSQPVVDLDSTAQRRLTVALALLTEPELLLCCDPLRQIDRPGQQLIGQILREFVAAGGALLALVDDLGAAMSYATLIGQLAAGQISWQPADQVRSQAPLRLTGRYQDTIVFIKPAELLYATVEQRQTWLYTTDRRVRSQATLSELADQLAGHGFFRSHRAFLVNLQHVAEIITYTRDSYGIVLADKSGQQIPLSKQSYRELRDQLAL